MNYFLDSNIILLAVRNEAFRNWLNQHYLSKGQNSIISVISIGELRSLAIRNAWGEAKWLKMREIIATFLIADIHSEDVIQRYAEIDAFSQEKSH